MKCLKRTEFLILFILFAGAFLRFRGLTWGLPYPFHPDERNMADALLRLSPENLDPEFYAYGQFPLYLAYFTGRFFFSLIEGDVLNKLNFIQAILALRFWSAFFSSGTIYLVYLVFKKIFPSRKSSIFNFSLLAAIGTAFTPGLIQAAHFGTTESILTFCFLTIVYFSLRILEKPDLNNFFGAGLFLGLALGSKISAVVFTTPIALGAIWQLKKSQKVKEKFKILFLSFLTLALAFFLTLLTSPYLILAYPESRGTLLYEISVAQGASLPFYTRQFFNTLPILFQFQKIFPYVLGLPIFLLGTLGFLSMTINLVRKKQDLNLTVCSLLLASFLVYFFSNAFLFTKWTRFMTPVFPFFTLFADYLLGEIFFLLKSPSRLTLYSLFLTALVISPGLYFSSLYFRPDIRFTASEWIYQNIPSDSHVLSETANVIDIPITPPYLSPPGNYRLSPISFNFYELDENEETFEKLLDELVLSDYIFVPSRRLFANVLRLPQKYPLTAKYYQLLFSGKLGFQEIKVFDPFPNFLILNSEFSFSDEKSEETFTVFDHPVIRIYQKNVILTKNQYEELFGKI